MQQSGLGQTGVHCIPDEINCEAASRKAWSCPWYWNKPELSIVLIQTMNCPQCWHRAELPMVLKQSWAVHGTQNELSHPIHSNTAQLSMVLRVMTEWLTWIGSFIVFKNGKLKRKFEKARTIKWEQVELGNWTCSCDLYEVSLLILQPPTPSLNGAKRLSWGQVNNLFTWWVVSLTSLTPINKWAIINALL